MTDFKARVSTSQPMAVRNAQNNAFVGDDPLQTTPENGKMAEETYAAMRGACPPSIYAS